MPEVVTRKPRTLDAIEAIEEPDSITVVEVDESGGGEQKPDAEAQLEALNATLADKDAELANARAEAVTARRAAAEAGNTVVSAAHRAVAERESNIDSAIEARKTMIANARRALKAAMDASDAEAVADAQTEIATATAETVQLQRDKGQVEADKERLKAAPAARQEQPRGPSAESLAWIRAHPRFNSDPEYQAAVTAADKAYVTLHGWDNYGKKHYVDFVESTMTDRFGEGHGKTTRSSKPTASRERPASSTAARADAGADGGGSSGGANGSITLKHAQGTISLRRNADGKETIVGTIPSTWAEAARWCGMTPQAYAIDQIHIQDQKRRGEDVGLRMGDGEVMQ